MISTRKMAISITSAVLSVNLICAQDLSTYRGFQLGMNLQEVAQEAGIAPSTAKVIHVRPALVQELNLRRLFSPSSSPHSNRGHL